MIAMSFRTFKIKVLVFTLSNLLSEVDTQPLNISYEHTNIKSCPLQQILIKLYKYFFSRNLLFTLFYFVNYHAKKVLFIKLILLNYFNRL